MLIIFLDNQRSRSFFHQNGNIFLLPSTPTNLHFTFKNYKPVQCKSKYQFRNIFSCYKTTRVAFQNLLNFKILLKILYAILTSSVLKLHQRSIKMNFLTDLSILETSFSFQSVAWNLRYNCQHSKFLRKILFPLFILQGTMVVPGVGILVAKRVFTTGRKQITLQQVINTIILNVVFRMKLINFNLGQILFCMVITTNRFHMHS